jgi:hypothetical protein
MIAAAVMGVGAMTLPARAGDRDDRDKHFQDGREVDRGERFRGYGRDDHRDRWEDRREDHRDHREGRIKILPVYRTVQEKVWVPPVYRTEVQRVYREPVYQDVVERVWVPDQYEVRVYQEVDQHGHVRHQKRRVLIHRGHHIEQVRRVEVKPGCWEEVPRQVLVCEGYWKTVERQELVSAPAHSHDWREGHGRRDRDKFEFGLSIDF